MISSGATWAQLLEAGEWRSAAALNYVHPATVDAHAYMDAIVAASSDEE